MRISVIQSDLVWENVNENLKHFSQKVLELEGETDVIVLPEMFTTGFSMKSKKLAETMDGETVSWLRDYSEEVDALIIASLIILENDKFYNRLICAFPDGKIEFYDKRHLFRMANENDYYSQGTEKLIIEYKGWRIRPLVCYDLRFPVWSRNKNDYDLLIYIANWPERRNEPWKTLLKARAIENQAYVVGVNRVGTDENSIVYSGDSAIISPKGNLLSTIKPHKEETETVEISLDNLNQFRENFPVGKDADEFWI